MERELLDATDAGRLLGVSRSTVHELHRAGALPDPVYVGRGTRWRTRELIAWVEAGCPHRDSFTWRPTMPAKLEAFIGMLHSQITELQHQVREAEARLARGDTRTSVSRN